VLERKKDMDDNRFGRLEINVPRKSIFYSISLTNPKLFLLLLQNPEACTIKLFTAVIFPFVSDLFFHPNLIFASPLSKCWLLDFQAGIGTCLECGVS